MKFLIYSVLLGTLLLAEPISPLPTVDNLTLKEKVAVPFDMETYKGLWKERIGLLKAQGIVPLIDVESTFSPKTFDPLDYAKMMDRYGVALIAFSAHVLGFEKNKKVWNDTARLIMKVDPYRYVPTTVAGIHPVWPGAPLEFVKKTIAKAESDNYPLLGEFEFRHYPSPRQVERNEFFRDVTIPIESEAAHLLFAFSQRTGKSFQIHYEAEDELFAPLEKMLTSYPGAKVIWCHLGQIRYSNRTKLYTPAYIKTLLERHPNLYFDLAFGASDSVYKPSGEYHATLWQGRGNSLNSQWKALIEAYPYRFLMAFDIGGDRHDELPKKVDVARDILKNFSLPTQEIIAYKAFWKLVFNELL